MRARPRDQSSPNHRLQRTLRGAAPLSRKVRHQQGVWTAFSSKQGLSVFATALLFVAYYVFTSTLLIEASLALPVAASIWLVIENRKCSRSEAQPSEARADA